MTLEESVGEEDEIFEDDSITFVIERSLNENLGEIFVDFAPDKGMVVQGVEKS